MIDIRLVRNEIEIVKAALGRRGVDPAEVDRLARLDEEARSAMSRRDDCRSQVKALSAQVGEARRSGDTTLAGELADRSRLLGDEERALNTVAEAAQHEVRQALLYLPNLPAPEAPDGAGPEDNVEVRRWPATPPTYAPFQRLPHWEIGTELGLLDMERGAKLSGSMFPLYRGFGARLLRALTAFALDSHADEFEEVRPPTLVRTETMVSTGHLPKFEEEAYQLERDDLWAIPTAEVPLTSMWRGDILDQEDLPLRLTAATACFRREAGAAGRDTRGLLRVHEFDKVELFAYTTPEQAPDQLDAMVARAERLLQDLGLQYRVLDLCAGDMGNSAARTYDLEVYSPGVDQWLEVSSVSWCSDYQARRANIRYRTFEGGSPVLVHTLNGSALAWARIWAALMETGRRADGSVALPDVLGPYLRGQLEIPVPARAQSRGAQSRGAQSRGAQSRGASNR
jgi:seryl-tRNA synthetase